MLEQQGRFAEAEPILREALAIRRKRLDAQHPDIAVSLSYLGEAVRRHDNLAEAEACFREALDIIRKHPGDQTITEVTILCSLGATLMAEHKFAEAANVWSEAAAIHQQQIAGQADAQQASILNELALAQTQADKPVEAEATWRALLACRRKMLAQETAPDAESFRGLLIALDSLALSLLDQDNFTEAEIVAREGLQIGEAHLSADWQTSAIRSTLGESLVGLNKIAEAEPLLLQAVASLERQKGELSSPSILTAAIARVVRLYQLTNRPEQAGEWSKKLPPAK
jgi:tetratricopeptide (TPR) repeat protein